MSSTFWLKIKNWDKHNPRKDIKKPSWFAFDNRMIEDEDLFDFTHGEFKVWIYILSKASQKVSPTVRISPAHAEKVCNISAADLGSAVAKLISLGMVSTDVTGDEIHSVQNAPVHDSNVSVQIPNADVQNPYSTGEDRGGQDSTEQDRGGEDSTGPTAAVFEIGNGPIEAFAQSNVLSAPLSKVPKNLQQAWVDQWVDTKWITKTLEKTFQKRLAAGAGPNEDWARTFTTWLFSEREKPRRPPKESTEPIYRISQEQAWDTFQANLKARGVDSFVKLLPGGH